MAHSQNIHAVTASQIQFLQRKTVNLLRGTQLHNGEAILLHFDVVNHAAAHQVRRALARIQIRVDDMVRTHATQNTAMLRGRRLHPDRRNTHVDEVRRNEHSCFKRRPHADNGAAELARPQLLKRVLGSRVSLNERETTGESLHARGILFNGQDLVAQLILRHRHCRAETAQPNDQRSRLEFL